MKYLGGKFRIRKQVASYINNIRKQGQNYIEPFVGGGNIMMEIDATKGNNFAYDIHPGLITLYNSIKSGWIPPDTITEQQYQELKIKNDMNNPLTAFAGFGCSFSGKYWGGYARDPQKPERNYANECKNNLLSMKPNIIKFNFETSDYYKLNPIGSIIYCDPPYNGTTKYKNTSPFNYIMFYGWCIRMSQNNTILISEYSMPEKFKCVLELKTKTDMQCKNGKSERTEKLWTIESARKLLTTNGYS